MKSKTNIDLKLSLSEDQQFIKAPFEIEFPLFLKSKNEQAFYCYTHWGKSVTIKMEKNKEGKNICASFIVFDAVNFYEKDFDKYGLELTSIIRTNVLISEDEFHEKVKGFNFFSNSIFFKFREWNVDQETRKKHLEFYEKVKELYHKQNK